MRKFYFNQNYNGKLFNDVFSDIQLNDNTVNTDDECEIFYQQQKFGTAKIAAIRRFNFSRLSDTASWLNSGKPAPAQASLLNRYYNKGEALPPDQLLMQIVFQYTEIDSENQSLVLKDWWEEKTEKSWNNN